jgi:predicted RND superfamily exporter protein
MAPMTRQRWINFLGWVADRPRGAAVASLLMLIAVAATIRAPIIEGSMVDELSGTNERLEIAHRIIAATGDETAVAIMVTPADVSIGVAFEELASLRANLKSFDESIALRTVDASSDQLFAYGLSASDSIFDLLEVLRDNPDATTIINAEASRFLVVVSVLEDMEPGALDVITAHGLGRAAAAFTVLATTQLELDVASGLVKDLRLLIPVIVGVTLLALFLAFGYWRALLLPLCASIASTAATFALFTIMSVTVNLVTLIALPVVLIVGLANSCHFLAKSSAQPVVTSDIDGVVRSTLQRVGPPFFFSTLTTAIALASLGFNELPPIANFGLLSAAALLIVFLLVLLAAPLLLRWYLVGAKSSWREIRLISALSRRLAAGRAIISTILLLGMLGGAVSLPLLTVKSDPRAFFPDDAPFSSALMQFESEFYVFSPLRALVTFTGDDRIGGLRAAGRVRDSLAGHSGVRQVSIRPAVNDDNAYVLSALLATTGDLPDIVSLLDDAGRGADVDVIYSNAELVYGDIDRQAMESLLRSLCWSVALIFGAILVLFRSARALLSALLANAVPLMLVCGAVWLIGNPLNLVTVFVFLVALGVIVDDSIHILFWRAAGDSVSGSSIEFSVLLSTFMLCLGLLLCQLSDFPTTRLFAAYCALALVAAVISNLTVLPQLLRQPQTQNSST